MWSVVIFLMVGKFFFVVLKWFTVTWFIVMFMIGLWEPGWWWAGKYGWPIDIGLLPLPITPEFFFLTFFVGWKMGGKRL